MLLKFRRDCKGDNMKTIKKLRQLYHFSREKRMCVPYGMFCTVAELCVWFAMQNLETLIHCIEVELTVNTSLLRN
jgi:hypothetical protein